MAMQYKKIFLGEGGGVDVDKADVASIATELGKYLKANGMQPLEHIADISSRLIVNKASMRTRNQIIASLLEGLAAAVASRRDSCVVST